MTRRRDYVSYLLRLWRTGSGKKAVWRASLEDPLTGERQGFASLKDLVAFLEAHIGNRESAPDDSDEPVNVSSKDSLPDTLDHE
jgi:hypothetical protein